MTLKSLLTHVSTLVFAAVGLLTAADQQPSSVQEFFTFDELLDLSQGEFGSIAEPSRSPLTRKLDRILSSPVINREAVAEPHRPTVNGIGTVLRVAFWNIERGLEFDLIRAAFTDFREHQSSPEIEQQARVLRDADIIVLNEVDLGMKRTDYRDVAKELAASLGMNYVFGVEFVEVDRLEDLGVDPVRLEDQNLAQKMADELRADPQRYRGLHGNAILSRYPIQGARVLRLPVCHDWFHSEKAEISALEKGKRLGANKVFLERIDREVRLGGRMALIADVLIPEAPSGSVSVISAHLENRCKPGCRAHQMDALLAGFKEIDHPVILGGDLNTSGSDGTPTSVRREIMNRVKNYEFWATQALKWATPASLPLMAAAPIGYYKNYLDPTSTHLPIVGANPEAALFRHIERFRFRDGRAFDFRGDLDRNLHGRERTLANSNQRAFKGFEATFVLKRDFGGLVGRYKLDWLLISPYIQRPRGAEMSYQFAPHYPLTLRQLNSAPPDGISDHAPITVDLPFVSNEFVTSSRLDTFSYQSLAAGAELRP
jgi:endonuclease/exonuclease/phosphatase family metal-dependent hydrolase